jgi:ERCC4-type nuclease
MVICRLPTSLPKLPAREAADLDLFVCPFTVLQDTREQAPWAFQGLLVERRLWIVRRRVATLQTGDYSIAGCEDRLVVERKSASDLVGSVTAGNARFRREHERMQAVVAAGGFACVIVEGSLAAICDELDQEAGRRVTSESILGAVASWPQRYGVHWLFAGDRRRAELLAFKVMLKWWKEHGDG